MEMTGSPPMLREREDMKKFTPDQVVEIIARMDMQERDQFVKSLTYKWPHMATSLANMISLETMINKQKSG
jgi:hypothetical protein|tara:strand:- start:61 stop:273 length:213 start_codon:yes stop_codon:yes gene_type:complete